MLCPLPPSAVGAIDFGGPDRLVREKLAVKPPTVAVTVYGPPAVALAVRTGEVVATPDALVVAVVVATVTPGAPAVAGAVNVTLAPLTGFPRESFTVTLKAAKAVLIATLCGVPLVVRDAGGPAVTVTLVLPDAYPVADALTLIALVVTASPVTVGWVAGVVAPPATKTLGVTVALVGSPLVRFTVTPPAGAGFCKVMLSVTGAWPACTDRLLGMLIAGAVTTVTRIETLL